MLAALVATPFVAGACSNEALAGSSTITTVGSPASSSLATAPVKGLGTVLVTADGHTLYMNTSDPPGASNCSGQCALSWPPLEVRGKVRASAGVRQALISTRRGSGGALQVFYAGHALYTYALDGQAGMASGEGVTSYAGTWWAVSPSGRPLEFPAESQLGRSRAGRGGP